MYDQRHDNSSSGSSRRRTYSWKYVSYLIRKNRKPIQWHWSDWMKQRQREKNERKSSRLTKESLRKQPKKCCKTAENKQNLYTHIQRCVFENGVFGEKPPRKGKCLIPWRPTDRSANQKNEQRVSIMLSHYKHTPLLNDNHQNEREEKKNREKEDTPDKYRQPHFWNLVP